MGARRLGEPARSARLRRRSPRTADAIDEAAAKFYERFHFSRLADEFPCRMVLDLKPLLDRQMTN